MNEIVLSEHEINVLINKGRVKVILNGEEVIVRQSYTKDLRAETVNWDKQIVDVSQNIVRNKHFDSLFQNTFR
ncbi:hypothetical protein [Streptococcus phage PH10]|jgi:hypothetical protein|uniref:Uncharacterized protein n=2 Tax=root TaxID=1 RepID=C5J960_9CAUD|nr:MULTISPECIES: hypothetical protein [Streptococcus]YP_002925166.1 hypothetical protein PH10_gp33 [Streptococcus phage PH10]DAJ35624.1 MAG TPA: hypothetical protein [Caudoviricetes sp.]DAV01501.1 MAG TPA: hypothetical protein [Bacteriophage sp.]EFU63422.1 hypothetical protein HMPREF8578_0695 [Streptococcus oralis ATCC 49296]OFQ06671.1 hypothetical protein HMPREF2957_07390 [Streptococcus sp. HMSC062D07]CAY56526.1 hypothetical protein [Streptococcus phage PH10]